MEDELRMQMAILNSDIERRKWLRKCCAYIKQLNTILLCSKCLSVGQKQKIIARIIRLKSLQLRVKRQSHLKARYGSGLSSSSTEESPIIGLKKRCQKPLRWQTVKTAFKCRLVTGMIANIQHIDPKSFFQDARQPVIRHIQRSIYKHKYVKVNTVFHAEFKLHNALLDNGKYCVKSFTTRNFTLVRGTELKQWYTNNVQNLILTQLEEFQERDSGWALKKILDLTININRCELFSGGSYIAVPDHLKAKKSIVNVKSYGNDCFAWAVVSALYPAKANSDRITSYPHYNSVLNVTGLTFPITIDQIPNFEKNNGIAINVYELTDDESNIISPLYLSDYNNNKQQLSTINLLTIWNNAARACHYVWIKNLKQLLIPLSSQLSSTPTSTAATSQLLPKHLQNKHSIVNVKCSPEESFMWATVSALYPASKHADRKSSYPHYSTVFKMMNINLPMALKQIPTFEDMNELNINVYQIQNRKRGREEILPLYLSQSEHERCVNLAVYEAKDSTLWSYAWIKDLSRLIV